MGQGYKGGAALVEAAALAVGRAGAAVVALAVGQAEG